ncbi:hypothetical protein [Spirosoma humi]
MSKSQGVNGRRERNMRTLATYSLRLAHLRFSLLISTTWPTP